MATRTSRLGLKKKTKKEPQQLVERSTGSPLKIFSKYKKVPQSSLKSKKQFETSLEKERAKKARIEHRTKGSAAKKDTEKQRKRLAGIFGGQFEQSYEKRGTKGKTMGRKKGGMVRGYSTGGSVSRGQYPAQTRKTKFKGVF